MADRIKFIIQKRTSLKSQITGLTNLIERERYDKTALKLRIARITELYNAFEEFNDELALLDPNDVHKDEFINVQDKYYSLAAKVEEITNSRATSCTAIAGPSNTITTNNDSSTTTVTLQRKIKLPETSLPVFNGQYENWLSFKNRFLAMIDTRSDLCDIEKLQYLQAALTGEAANKLKILTIEGSNYSKAWDLLKRAYEVKRILISRHLSLLLNSPVLERETTEGLSKLADDAQQHVASLAALGVNVQSEILVNILESKLPKTTADKWEETLNRDEFPKIDDLYEFLYRTAVRVSKRARLDIQKREENKDSILSKRGRLVHKGFMTNTTNNCAVCKNKNHPLFKCDKFKQFDVTKRIEVIRNAKLCYICLRSHKGKPCGYSNCQICQKRHNTLLHLDKFTADATKNSAATIKADESK